MQHTPTELMRRKLNVFGRPKEKGGREWDAFHQVRDDHTGMFEVPFSYNGQQSVGIARLWSDNDPDDPSAPEPERAPSAH